MSEITLWLLMLLDLHALGADEFGVREHAQARLQARGYRAALLVRLAGPFRDPERARRARRVRAACQAPRRPWRELPALDLISPWCWREPEGFWNVADDHWPACLAWRYWRPFSGACHLSLLDQERLATHALLCDLLEAGWPPCACEALLAWMRLVEWCKGGAPCHE
jgi:hypothetical protein